MSIEWPVSSVNISQGFGANPEFYAGLGQLGHNGVDLAVPLGTPVFATDAGVIHAEGWGHNDSWMGSPAGIFVRIQHSWGYSAVAHLSGTVVNAGQSVARGQHIGYAGQTGLASGPHVHFEVFPPSPNFSNGYAGRITPYTFEIVPHGTGTPPVKPPVTPTIRKGKKMYFLHTRGQAAIFVTDGLHRRWMMNSDHLNNTSNHLTKAQGSVEHFEATAALITRIPIVGDVPPASQFTV